MIIYFNLFKYSVNYSIYVFIWINFFIIFGNKYAEKYLAAKKGAALTKSSRCHVVETSRLPSRTGKATPSRHRWCENDVARDDDSYVQYNLPSLDPQNSIKQMPPIEEEETERRKREEDRSLFTRLFFPAQLNVRLTGTRDPLTLESHI